MNVTDFLLARLAEDEATARAAVTSLRDDADWLAEHDWSGRPAIHEGGSLTVVTGMMRTIFACSGEAQHDDGDAVGVARVADARHVARHDPARVLRQVEAMRRVVEEHPLVSSPRLDGQPGCAQCLDQWEWGPEVASGPCDTLLALAAIWSDHPDYREEWRA